MYQFVRRLSIAALFFATALSAFAREQWSAEEAHKWYGKKPWLVGCNFSPSSAINQLEMWQSDSWDPKTIDRELGFNSVRVFLHHLLWQQDSKGFIKRIDQFLRIANRHHIGVILVPLDGVCFTTSSERMEQPSVQTKFDTSSP